MSEARDWVQLLRASNLATLELAQNSLRNVLGLPISERVEITEREVPFQPVKIELDRWIRDMNLEIWNFGTEDHRYREMGTTLALIYQQADFVAVAHVGDSRVYRVRGGQV